MRATLNCFVQESYDIWPIFIWMVNNREQIVDSTGTPVVKGKLAVSLSSNLPEGARIERLHSGKVILQEPIAGRLIKPLIKNPRQVQKERGTKDQQEWLKNWRSSYEQVSKYHSSNPKHAS